MHTFFDSNFEINLDHNNLYLLIYVYCSTTILLADFNLNILSSVATLSECLLNTIPLLQQLNNSVSRAAHEFC